MTTPADDKIPVLADDRRSVVIGQLTDADRRRLFEARMDPRHANLNTLIEAESASVEITSNSFK